MLPALIAAGGSILGGLLQGSAAEKAKDAQIHAQMLADQRMGRATEEARLLQGPYVQGGYAGYNALTSRLGLPGGAVNAATQRAQANIGADWGAYGAANPDLQAAAQQAVGRGDYANLNEFYRAHWENGGRNEGRSLGNQPALEMQPPAGGGGSNALTGGNAFGNTQNPTAPPAYQAPTYQGPSSQSPESPAMPQYQNSLTAPAPMTDPGRFEYGLDDYRASPGYQWQQDQAQKSTMASATATGALRSGAALKALQDRAQQIAYQDFGNERAHAFSTFQDGRNFTYGLSRDARGDYQDDRNFGRSVYQDDRDFGYGQHIDNRNFGYTQSRDSRRDYETDRNYLTDRYDRETDDLFRYTGMGQNAAGVVTNAALGQGTSGANLALAGGDSRSGNALQQGSIWSGVAGDISGLAASYFNRGRGLDSYMSGAVNSRPDLF